MEFDLQEIEELSGAKARIYSVVLDGEEDSLLEQFINENAHQYPKEVQKIFGKIRIMAENTGCKRIFLEVVN